MRYLLFIIIMFHINHAIYQSSTYNAYKAAYVNHLYLQPSDIDTVKQGDIPQEMYFKQKLDHFNVLNPDRFNQRFFMNRTFWDHDTGPVFLYIGGEGPISPYDVILGHHVQLAERYHALIVAIEHRFYGKSWPLPDASIDNLRYLSSDQALADLANFIDHLKEKLHLTDDNVMISFGGSYPGALSAWLRMKYPSQVYAAVASSAPIRARVGFYGYMKVVGQSFGNEEIGGSSHCQERIRQAFREVETVYQSPNGLNILERSFKSCQPLNGVADYTQMVQSLASVFQGAVQYNDQVPLNVDKICSMFNEHSDSAIDHLITMNNALIEKFPSQCHSFSYQGMVQSISDTSYRGDASDRQWIYQTCTELGYYQECQFQHNCLFSERIDLETSLRLCRDLFQITPDLIFDSIRFTNTQYGGFHPDAARILFVNGDIDPWHSLSIVNDQHDKRQTAVFIRGASHCQDMKPSHPTDTEELMKGREKIDDIINQWLNEAANQHNDPVQSQ